MSEQKRKRTWPGIDLSALAEARSPGLVCPRCMREGRGGVMDWYANIWGDVACATCAKPVAEAFGKWLCDQPRGSTESLPTVGPAWFKETPEASDPASKERTRLIHEFMAEWIPWIELMHDKKKDHLAEAKSAFASLVDAGVGRVLAWYAVHLVMGHRTAAWRASGAATANLSGGDASRPCGSCKSSKWWISINNVAVCGVCHPPADPSLVRVGQGARRDGILPSERVEAILDWARRTSTDGAVPDPSVFACLGPLWGVDEPAAAQPGAPVFMVPTQAAPAKKARRKSSDSGTDTGQRML